MEKDQPDSGKRDIKFDDQQRGIEIDVERMQEWLDDCVERIAARFPTVLLLVGYENKHGDPFFMSARSGDYFAAKGLCHTWLDDETATATAEEVYEAIGPSFEEDDDDDDDDDESWKKPKEKIS